MIRDIRIILIESMFSILKGVDSNGKSNAYHGVPQRAPPGSSV